jgi:hypothetical protein
MTLHHRVYNTLPFINSGNWAFLIYIFTRLPTCLMVLLFGLRFLIFDAYFLAMSHVLY